MQKGLGERLHTSRSLTQPAVPGVSGDTADGPHLETQDLMRGSGGNLLWKQEGAGEKARRSPRVRPATWQAFYQAH